MPDNSIPFNSTIDKEELEVIKITQKALIKAGLGKMTWSSIMSAALKLWVTATNKALASIDSKNK